MPVKHAAPEAAPDTIPAILRSKRGTLTVEELASIIGCSDKYLYKQAKRGAIPVTSLPGMIRFDRYLVARWWEDNTTTPIGSR